MKVARHRNPSRFLTVHAVVVQLAVQVRGVVLREEDDMPPVLQREGMRNHDGIHKHQCPWCNKHTRQQDTSFINNIYMYILYRYIWHTQEFILHDI